MTHPAPGLPWPPSYRAPYLAVMEASKTVSDTLLMSWNARHGRRGILCFGPGHCMVCQQDRGVFTVDGSEDEYEPLVICPPCLNAFSLTKETMKDKLTITDAAMLLHKNNRVFCAILGDDSHSNWGNLDEGIRKSAIAGVETFLANPNITPEQQHQAWVDWKQANGWKLGAKKDIEKKTHPNLVPYDKLSAVEKAKDEMFVALLKAIAPLIEIPKPKEEAKPAAPATEAAPAPAKS